MATRNQNRAPRSPTAKKGGAIEVPVDKRRKIGAGRMTARQPLVDANHKEEGADSSDPGSIKDSESTNVVFTKEDVEALLKEVLKLKKFDTKGNMQLITDQNKRFKLGLRWSFHEQERLQIDLESANKKCIDTETEMEKKVMELNASMANLRNVNAALDKKLATESAEKLDAINLHSMETEARIAAERLQASLSEDLEIMRQEKQVADQEVVSLKEIFKRLQEYNTSLQQYNTKLQTDLSAANESLTRVEKEKMAIVENLSTLRGHYNSMQDQLMSSRADPAGAGRHGQGGSIHLI